jgi:exonuclease III
MNTQQCTKCNEVKDLVDFALKKGKIRSICKKCNNEYFYKWYKANKSTQTARLRANRKKNRKTLQEFVVNYFKSNPCVDCGMFNILVLEFDHTQGKKENVSHLMRQGCTLKRLKEEIELCEVRCCNCHRIKTLSRLGKHYRMFEGSDS